MTAPLSAFSSRINSRICACKVTSSAVVGSSAMRRRGSPHHELTTEVFDFEERRGHATSSSSGARIQRDR